VAQANAWAPLPTVIEFTRATNSAWPGVELAVTGDIEIRGAGSEFDARTMSRHFVLKPDSALSLRHLTLKNGRAKAGGSIIANDAFLHCDGVHFESNQAWSNDGGQGGAIHLTGGAMSVGSGRYLIKNSSFDSNSSLLRGGGLHSLWSDRLWIDNCKFNRNSAQSGSAIYYRQRDSWSKFYLLGSELIGNTLGSALFFGGSIHMQSTKLLNATDQVANCAKGRDSYLIELNPKGGNVINDQSCN
jgi:hypothetical protein